MYDVVFLVAWVGLFKNEVSPHVLTLLEILSTKKILLRMRCRAPISNKRDKNSWLLSVYLNAHKCVLAQFMALTEILLDVGKLLPAVLIDKSRLDTHRTLHTNVFIMYVITNVDRNRMK